MKDRVSGAVTQSISFQLFSIRKFQGRMQVGQEAKAVASIGNKKNTQTQLL